MRREFLSIERQQPRANAFPKRCDLYIPICGGEWIKPPQCCAQQGCSASKVSPLKMVKRCRYLDQSLEKCLVWLLTLQPSAFPVFVSEEKLLCLIASQTLCKRAATPVKRHRSIIIIQCQTDP